MGVVTFNAIESSVSEGDTTAGVCLSVNATSLNCNITITLTTNPGQAGMPYVYDVNVVIHFESLKQFHF